jgi:nicotinamidase-related amidase
MMDMILEPKTTALVLIDLQKGIVGRPLAPHSGASVVEKSVALARRLKELGGTVVAVHVAFSNPDADRLKQPVDATMPVPPGGFPAEFSEFAPEIAALKADVIVTKRQWGAFYGTGLDMQLRRRGVKTIILCGIATNFGVESTARDAWEHNYSLIIPEDACTSMDEGMHRFSIEKILPRLSRIRSTQQIIAAMQAA